MTSGHRLGDVVTHCLSPLVIGLVNTVHLARGSPGQGENSASNETSLYELKIYGMTFRRTFHQAVKG